MSDLKAPFIQAAAAAAQACRPWIGKGDKDAADQAAVEAMRQVLGQAPISGRIVIGEGERDEAPMLHIGEELGTGGPAIDIAVDPLEGTTLCAENRPGALCVLSYAPRGDLLHAPDIYMDKMAVGPGFTLGLEDLDRPLGQVLARLGEELMAQGKARAPRVIMLDRPRHKPLMDQVQAGGAELHLIGDGDVMASLQTALVPVGETEPAFDLYVGTGGAPEGVLASSGLQHLGGSFIGRLNATNAAEAARAKNLNLNDLSAGYRDTDLAAPSATLVLAGVTDHVLAGPSDAGVDVWTLAADGQSRQRVPLA